ncbi:30S ribosomal protein S16 [Alienimonas californiensis]|uniref:Small ribosomal subunit protein bS16 n=2 Tax=Alienimonas californiensis TaxID=2527989 RepID=A0A517PCE0_9PLAN|nr:30S ribosomal protein S16 [Alienimonas californiensis]
MKRLGRTHRPFYRICVMDSRVQRDGKAIEEVGHYDPMVPDKSKRVKLDLERIDYWVGVGAQPSHKVGVLIKKVRKNDFGTAKAPPPLTAPKEEAKPVEEAPAEETAEAPAEETAAE